MARLNRVQTDDDTQTGIDMLHTPSQAEGDRDTIDDDLKDKGLGSQD